jgi:hypothetical protein
MIKPHAIVEYTVPLYQADPVFSTQDLAALKPFG